MVSPRTDTYFAVHRRLGRERGPARSLTCTDCGQPAHHWSYDKSDPDGRVGPNGEPYSLDLSRYVPRCRSCHVTADGHGCFPTGAANPSTKLTPEDVESIRAARVAGDSLYAIADRFRVTPTRVWQLTKGIPSPNPRIC